MRAPHACRTPRAFSATSVAIEYFRAPKPSVPLARRLVWCPPSFNTFVLVDDEGALLATGTPTGRLPHQRERMENYMLCRGGRYAKEAERVGSQN